MLGGLEVWVPFMLCSQINTMLLPLCCDLRGRAEGQIAHRMMIYSLACREVYFIRWRVFSASATSLAGRTSTGCPESCWLALLQPTEPHRWLEDILRTDKSGWGQQPLWQIFLSLRNGTFAMHFSARVCVLFRWKKSVKLLFCLFSYMPYEKQGSMLIVTHYTQIECQEWQVSFITSQSSSPTCLNLPQTTSKLWTFVKSDFLFDSIRSLNHIHHIEVHLLCHSILLNIYITHGGKVQTFASVQGLEDQSKLLLQLKLRNLQCLHPQFNWELGIVVVYI